MQRQWYLIDEKGIRPVGEEKSEPENFWELFDQSGADAPWPDFVQVLVDASAGRVVEGLLRSATTLELQAEEVTDKPELWEGSLLLTEEEGHTLIGEPGVDEEDRIMAALWSEELFGELRCDGAYFGFDPAAGTLFLTVYEAGRPLFAWCDSLLPGPSYAMVFDKDGQCRDEDPRRFALRRMDMPITSPLLDRHHFLRTELARFGLEQINPELENSPIAAVVKVKQG